MYISRRNIRAFEKIMQQRIIHTLDQMLEKAKEYGIEVLMVFVDFRKAFDTIKHTKIWEALEKQK